MKLNRKLVLVLALVLSVAMATGGTLAYLTDRDSVANVLTFGNVEITLNEVFDQGSELIPGVKIEKEPTITNTGKNDAWVWATIAIPTAFDNSDASQNVLHFNYDPENVNATEWLWKEAATGWDVPTVQIDNILYNLYTVLYQTALKPGETTSSVMTQVYLDKHIDIDSDGNMYYVNNGNVSGPYWNVKTDGNPVMYVSAYAMQKDTFDTVQDAYAAYTAQWGDKGTEYGAPAILDADAAELTDAMTELPDGTDITTKVNKIIFGKKADYPEITGGSYESKTSENGITAYYVPNGDNYTVYMLSDGVIYAPETSRSLFQGMTNVTEIDTSNLDFSHVTDALGMFANCSKLEKLDTADWDVSNITNMQSIFYGCNNLSDIDVSNWDTSNVTNMRMVFFRCYELPNDVLKGVENWDVSNVSNFYSMFKHAYGLTSLDLSQWDTSNATNMSHMFANIDGLEELDLSGFNTAKVTDMSWMFYGASKLKSIKVGDGWTTAALDPTKPTCFYNNQALVGGAGTTWTDVADIPNASRPWESSAKIEYAIVDGGTAAPGLLTYKN